MIQHGIEIFNEDGTSQYDSRKAKLTVDPGQDPPHLDVFEQVGGTAWVVSPGQYREEVLFEMAHQMKFYPLATFYFEEAASPTGGEGWYSQNLAYMSLSAGFTDGVSVQPSADKKKVQIIHWSQNNSGTNSFTSKADQYLYRIKYMIFNQRDLRFD